MQRLMTLLVFLAAVGCNTSGTTSSLRDAGDATPAVYDGHIRLSLTHPFNAKKDDYELLLSVPADVHSLAVCEVKAGATCAAGTPEYFLADLIYLTPTRRFFKPAVSALLEEGLLLSFIGYDKAGTVIDTRTVAMKRIGGELQPEAQPVQPDLQP